MALQGAFLEHANVLRKLGVIPVEVRLPEDLTDLDGLIIPGGESTTIGKLATQFGLIEPLRRFIDGGRVVWGTCAGLIFLAKDIGATHSGGHVVPTRIPVVDIIVDRNTGRSKGFGFVEMSNDEEAQAAIDGLNGKELGGRTLNVNKARPRTDRPRGGSGGGGRRW